MTNELIFSLEAYSGPLDLLLDLIQKNKLNIYDIPINFITQEYINVLRRSSELGLEIKVEFLYLASNLLNIKTRMLLPTIEDDDEDPRINLVEQLIMYEQFRNASEELIKCYDKNSFSYDRLMSPEAFTTEIVYKIDGNILNLRTTFDSLLANAYEEASAPEVKLYKDKFPLEILIGDINRTISNIKKISFSEMTKCKEKQFIITAFFAILELMHMGKINIKQKSNFGEIVLESING